jgi:UDP-N-acetylglucosamine 3-dehydrogenase
VKVGVIGAGVMGENHIRTYSQISGAELVGIADVDKKRVTSLAKKYNAEGFTDYHELLKQELDAVSIVVPTTLHTGVGLDVIDKGINLLVEKPIATTIEHAWTLVKAARKEDVKLMVGHIERFNPAVMNMKELIDHNKLGKIVSINTRRVGPYNPRIRDVGVILDIGVHDLDIIAHLYNAQPQEVYAIAGKDIHSEEDHASVILRFENSKAGVVETNWLTPHKTRTFTVVGTEAVGYGDYMEQKVTIHDANWIREAKIEKKEPLRNELEHFLDCCKTGRELLASGEDGINALNMALAAIESYKSSTVVKIITPESVLSTLKNFRVPPITN